MSAFLAPRKKSLYPFSMDCAHVLVLQDAHFLTRIHSLTNALSLAEGFVNVRHTEQKKQ